MKLFLLAAMRSGIVQGVLPGPARRGGDAGLDSAQKKWWEEKGQKKYPGLCPKRLGQVRREAAISGDLAEVEDDRLIFDFSERRLWPARKRATDGARNEN